MSSVKIQLHKWEKDPRNPVLPPSPEGVDSKACMNPFVIRRDDTYWLFYAGGDEKSRRQICLATAPVSDVGNWTRHGAVLEVGESGAFDEFWCVLPCVHRIGGRWHLYYTGRSYEKDAGLQAFAGIGLAVSDDLKNWTRFGKDPVLRGDGFPKWPDNRGIAGGARIIEIPQPDGRILYRMYYTLANGVPSSDLLVDQEKHAVVAHSYDGITWTDRRVVLSPRREADYENAGVIALNIWREGPKYRAIYGAIGSRFGAYSICEAISDDGLVWQRGEVDENLSIPPSGDGWESRMVEYPNVIEENGRLRLFYCGNGYGATGIGTAIADKLED